MEVTAADIEAAKEAVMELRMELDKLQTTYSTYLDLAVRQLEEAGIEVENRNSTYLTNKLKEVTP